MKSTLTSKGQITIPIEIRRATGLQTGAQVEFIVNTRKRIELVPRQGDIRALRGAVPSPASPITAQAMNEFLTRGEPEAPTLRQAGLKSPRRSR